MAHFRGTTLKNSFYGWVRSPQTTPPSPNEMLDTSYEVPSNKNWHMCLVAHTSLVEVQNPGNWTTHGSDTHYFRSVFFNLQRFMAQLKTLLSRFWKNPKTVFAKLETKSSKLRELRMLTNLSDKLTTSGKINLRHCLSRT